eukprot:4619716-Amphidinium_carterae.2
MVQACLFPATSDLPALSHHDSAAQSLCNMLLPLLACSTCCLSAFRHPDMTTLPLSHSVGS